MAKALCQVIVEKKVVGSADVEFQTDVAGIRGGFLQIPGSMITRMRQSISLRAAGKDVEVLLPTGLPERDGRTHFVSVAAAWPGEMEYLK